MAVYKLSEIETNHIKRFTSTFGGLDRAYGYPGHYGIPCGRLSLWSGEHGVGKTRLVAELMKRWAREGISSLIFQGEVSPEQFKGEKLGDFDSDLIGVSDDVDIEEQVHVIMDTGPQVAIFDSIQQIDEYRGGLGAKEIVRSLREIINVTGTHVIFLSHLGKDGKTKGRTDISHEVDIEGHLYTDEGIFYASEHVFLMKLTKNRYGNVQEELSFKHMSWGIKELLVGDTSDDEVSPVKKSAFISFMDGLRGR